MRSLVKELDDEDVTLIERPFLLIYYMDQLQFLGRNEPAPVGDTAVLSEAVQGSIDLSTGGIESSNEEVKPAGFRLHGCVGFDFFLSADAWHAYLNAARSFGWKPEGTHAPSDYEGDWDGSYASPDGQWVKSGDARRLGLALERLVNAVQSGEKMTEEQREAVKELEKFDKELSGAQELADYTLDGVIELCDDRDPWSL